MINEMERERNMREMKRSDVMERGSDERKGEREGEREKWETKEVAIRV